MCQIMCSMMGHEEIEIVVYNSCDCQNWPNVWDPHRRSVQCVDRLAACPCSDHLVPSLSSLHSVAPKAQRDFLMTFFPSFYLILFNCFRELSCFSWPRNLLSLCLGLRILPFFSGTVRDFHVSLSVYFFEKSSFGPLVYPSNNFP